MTTILDAGGVSTLAGNRARVADVRQRGEWPPIVPSVVLAEALTGDHRRDFHENRLLRLCEIEPTDEGLAREAARLRTAVGGTRPPGTVDAIVAATADRAGGATVLTSDPGDLRALSVHTLNEIRISPV